MSAFRRTLWLTALVLLPGAAGGVEWTPPASELADGHAFASHAAGAVRFAYDDGLRASEMPRGRQLLLVLSRHDPPQKPGELRDGFWVGFAPRPAANTDKALAAGEALRRAVTADLRGARSEGVKQATLAGLSGPRVDFTVPSREPIFAAPGKAPAAAGPPLVGWRHVVEAAWGRVEFHFIAPEDKAAERLRDLEPVLASLRLQPPRPATPDVAPALLDAEPVVGSWKSTRGLLEVSGDGSIRLRFDREKSYQLDRLGVVDYEKPVRQLEGRFSALDDVLHIRWADGSLLNMRWRVANGELLITDHHGRTTRLTRLYR